LVIVMNVAKILSSQGLTFSPKHPVVLLVKASRSIIRNPDFSGLKFSILSFSKHNKAS